MTYFIAIIMGATAGIWLANIITWVAERPLRKDRARRLQVAQERLEATMTELDARAVVREARSERLRVWEELPWETKRLWQERSDKAGNGTWGFDLWNAVQDMTQEWEALSDGERAVWMFGAFDDIDEGIDIGPEDIEEAGFTRWTSWKNHPSQINTDQEGT